MILHYTIKPIMLCVAMSLMYGCNDDLKTRINTLSEENHRLKIENTRLSNEYLKLKRIADARGVLKPPITVSFRSALMGHGLVAMLNTRTKNSITVLVSWKSHATGVKRSTQIHLDGANKVELGHLEGFPIEPGDTLSIENTEYEPLSITVNGE